MDLDGDGVVARGLRRYVLLVAEALGVGAEASVLQLHDPVSVYLASDRSVPGHGDWDLALLWDERHGWALGVETDGGAEVGVIDHMVTDVLPAPRVVADFVDRARQGGETGRPVPPWFAADDVGDRLAGYADCGHAEMPRSA